MDNRDCTCNRYILMEDIPLQKNRDVTPEILQRILVRLMDCLPREHPSYTEIVVLTISNQPRWKRLKTFHAKLHVYVPRIPFNPLNSTGELTLELTSKKYCVTVQADLRGQRHKLRIENNSIQCYKERSPEVIRRNIRAPFRNGRFDIPCDREKLRKIFKDLENIKSRFVESTLIVNNHTYHPKTYFTYVDIGEDR